MTFVWREPGESFESLLRRFSRATQKDGVRFDVKRHAFFRSKGEERRRKAAAAARRRTRYAARGSDASERTRA